MQWIDQVDSTLKSEQSRDIANTRVFMLALLISE